MAEWWYLDQAGQKQGPVAVQQLRQLAKAGRVHSGTLIWQTGMIDWAPAHTKIHGLVSTPLRTPQTDVPAVGGEEFETSELPRKDNRMLYVAISAIAVSVLLVGVLAFVLMRGPGGGPGGGQSGLVSRGDPLPTQLVGEWSGDIVFGAGRLPMRLTFAPDGRVRYGFTPPGFGPTPEVEIHAGMIGQIIPEVGGDYSKVEEFRTTADSCRFTVAKITKAGVQIRNIDDWSTYSGRINRMTFEFKYAGGVVNAEMTEQMITKEGSGMPMSVRFTLYQSGKGAQPVILGP